MTRAPIAAAGLAILFGLVPTSTPAQAPRPDRLTLDTYLEWESVTAPRLSPDGSQILFTRRYVDKVNDRMEGALWLMNADGSRQRFLAEGGGAEWSPDGTRIAYVTAGEPDGSQVFVRWMDAEGANTQITHVTESPSNLAWSPDGDWLAFSMLVTAGNAVADRPAGEAGGR